MCGQAIKNENTETPAVSSTYSVNSTSTNAANIAGDDKYILLQTAQAVALNEQNQKFADILLDSGSQRM